jgi:NADPH2:quinone reductase
MGKATDGAGMDIVLDPPGTTMVETDMAVTAPGGRIVSFGDAGGGEQAPLPPAGQLIRGNLAIGGFSVRDMWGAAPHRASAALRRILDVIADGQLEIVVDEVGSLDDVPAVRDLLAEEQGAGKYVVRLG